MSGKLVGRVLDAAEAGELDHLSRAAFHALIAIAERCLDSTEQGYAHNNRIRAAIRTGNSLRSTKRAVSELKSAGLVKVVRRGYRMPGGAAKSTLYQLMLTAPVSATQDGPNATHPVSATQDGPNAAPVGAKSAPVSAIYVPVSAIQGGPLNGILDGSLDGAANATPAVAPTPTPIPDEEPSPRCPKHRHIVGWVEEDCRDCARAKKDYTALSAVRAEVEQQATEARRKARDNCRVCEGTHWIPETEPPIRCYHGQERPA